MIAVGKQTTSEVKSKITSSSGVAPLFPIAGSDGGATPLWSEYSFQYYGTSFLIHLDKKYEQLSSGGSDGYGIDVGLTKASTCTSCNTGDQQAPTVSVTSPASGAQLNAATQHTITWTATDNVGVVSRAIYFSSNNGTSYTKVDSVLGNTGSYNWTVPSQASTTCKIRIYAYDAAGNKGTGTSANFTITATGILFNNKYNIPIAEKYKVTIMNIQGKELAKVEVKNLNEIDRIRKELPSGIHVINISAGDKKFVSKMKTIE